MFYLVHIHHVICITVYSLYLRFKSMKAARNKQALVCIASKKQEITIIESEEQAVECRLEMVAAVKIKRKHRFDLQVKLKQQATVNVSHDESSSISCIDFNSTSLPQKKDEESNISCKGKPIYKQVFVKNPAYTDKRKLAKDQTTLDPFLKDFKESQYLKTTKIISCKYKQTTLFDFRKGPKDEESLTIDTL